MKKEKICIPKSFTFNCLLELFYVLISYFPLTVVKYYRIFLWVITQLQHKIKESQLDDVMFNFQNYLYLMPAI